jgi:glutamate synthase domain-containing protein 3
LTGEDEADLLVGLIEQHVAHTGKSPGPAGAGQIGQPGNPRFVKVMPKEYKRALARLEKEKEKG